MWESTLNIDDQSTLIRVGPDAWSALPGLLAQTRSAKPPAPVVLVTDENVGPLYTARIESLLQPSATSLHEWRLPPGEAAKSIAALEKLYNFMAQSGLSRDGLVIALGGGVVSDLAGLAAATWMRGLPWVICPTSLEAMIDASIGGKTAINLPAGKNLVGAFHQPLAVLVEPTCLHTLEQRDLRAGLAESIKHALVADADFLAWHERHREDILQADPETLAELIARNVRIKADIVQRDPRETTGLRMILNYGHTLGHAIENLSPAAPRHGECVALGMVAAGRIATDMNLLDAATAERIESLLRDVELPIRLKPAPITKQAAGFIPRGRPGAGYGDTPLSNPPDLNDVLRTIRRDKKVRDGWPRFVLLQSPGHPVIRDDVTEDHVRRAWDYLLT